MSDSLFESKILNKAWVWSDAKTGFVADFELKQDTMVFWLINVVFGTPEPDLCNYKKEYIENIVCITTLKCKGDQPELVYSYCYLDGNKKLQLNASEIKLKTKSEILALEEWMEFICK